MTTQQMNEASEMIAVGGEESGALPHESKLYTRFTHLYDKIFYFFPRHIAKALRLVPIQPGEKILEVGVGTGLSLAAYPTHSDVTAIDVAPRMLERAQQKIEANGWKHISLLRMSALQMDFPDNSFDHVTAFHVVTVIPNPEQLMREISRVCKPKGTVVIINYFCGEGPASSFFHQMLDPFSRRMGWSYTLKLSDLLRAAPLQVEQQQKTFPLSPYTIVIARNEK